MKQLHRHDLYAWSVFNEARNIDFNSYVWVRPEGNVVFDPLPMSPHDRAHLDALGGVALIVVTNSDHLRASRELAAETGARLLGPRAEGLDGFEPLGDGDQPVVGMQVLELHGSKTPGELAVRLGEDLVCGDLVRSHAGGRLHRLPPPKLTDAEAAQASIERLAGLSVVGILVGDGYPIFRDGQQRLIELAKGA